MFLHNLSLGDAFLCPSALYSLRQGLWPCVCSVSTGHHSVTSFRPTGRTDSWALASPSGVNEGGRDGFLHAPGETCLWVCVCEHMCVQVGRMGGGSQSASHAPSSGPSLGVAAGSRPALSLSRQPSGHPSPSLGRQGWARFPSPSWGRAPRSAGWGPGGVLGWAGPGDRNEAALAGPPH